MCKQGSFFWCQVFSYQYLVFESTSNPIIALYINKKRIHRHDITTIRGKNTFIIIIPMVNISIKQLEKISTSGTD